MVLDKAQQKDSAWNLWHEDIHLQVTFLFFPE